MCVHRGQRTPYPLPQGERVTEFASQSSRNLPRRSVFRIRQHDAHCLEFITNTIGLLKILCLARDVARVDHCLNLGLVDASTLTLENFKEADRIRDELKTMGVV